jgi:hypothetical protein
MKGFLFLYGTVCIMLYQLLIFCFGTVWYYIDLSIYLCLCIDLFYVASILYMPCKAGFHHQWKKDIWSPSLYCFRQYRHWNWTADVLFAYYVKFVICKVDLKIFNTKQWRNNSTNTCSGSLTSRNCVLKFILFFLMFRCHLYILSKAFVAKWSRSLLQTTFPSLLRVRILTDLDSFMWGSLSASLQNVSGFTQLTFVP